MIAERFAVKDAQRQMQKNKKKGKGKGDSKDDEYMGGGGRTNSSAKVFSNLQKIVQDDYKRKESKRELKATGKQKAAERKGGDARKYLL